MQLRPLERRGQRRQRAKRLRVRGDGLVARERRTTRDALIRTVLGRATAPS